MAKLINKILSALNNDNVLDSTIEDISICKENLVKNLSNPVFDSKSKKSLLNCYNTLEDLEKSLNRYNVLIHNNYSQDAIEEKQNVMNLVLKTGISNERYVWRSENGKHTCAACRELDGQEFEFYDEIPPRPHPNCKCYIEVIEYENSDPVQQERENGELCDCITKIDTLISEGEQLQVELDGLISEISETQIKDAILFLKFKEFEQYIKNLKSTSAVVPCGENCVAQVTGMAANITNTNELSDILSKLTIFDKQAKQVYKIFQDNKQEMERIRNGMDKYYHSKANCESAELGEVQKLFAILFSIAKELYDFKLKVFNLHMEFDVVVRDCFEDLKADWYGILKAKDHGFCSDKVKDVNDYVFNKKHK